MLTQDFVKAIQAKLAEKDTKVSQAAVKEQLDAMKDVVVDALGRGEDIELKGFVSFVSKEVAAGTARNPQTGEEVAVPAHRKASAKLAKSLRKFA